MDDTKPKTFVFVLMPFSDDFKDVYEVGIKPACKDAGAYCERVDEQIYEESILERVYNQISKADVIVAEMTGRNANVFYETGYAHALNKRVILLTQNADDIPFDLKHYPHIIYSGKIAILKPQLEARIRWCIENPKESIEKTDINLEFYINGVPITRHPAIQVERTHSSDKYIQGEVSLDVHNKGANVIDFKDIKACLVMEEETARKFFNHPFINGAFHKLPDSRYMLRLDRTDNDILPDSWSKIGFRVAFSTKDINLMPVALTLRLYSPFGKQDYPLMLHPPSSKDKQLT